MTIRTLEPSKKCRSKYKYRAGTISIYACAVECSAAIVHYVCTNDRSNKIAFKKVVQSVKRAVIFSQKWDETLIYSVSTVTYGSGRG